MPPEGRPKIYIIVLREVSLAAMIFNGGLITLPPVPRFIQMNETDERSSSHQETRHSRRVNSDAQSHRLAENKVTSFIRQYSQNTSVL